MREVLDLKTYVEKCELMELPCVGYKYTLNDKHGDHRIFSKIDCAFINQEWLDNTPMFQATYKYEGISGHYPLRIYKVGDNNRAKRSFKYSNVWHKHPQFL